ncbi:MAG: hydrogenase maturation nickel metallochaperone HypA [Candidatus Aenigmarchaeota archaeon]|nr:hydrogenase maturation nickel metallochaperone HypA [Candidatus Aenigmarchaeota archaeon]
MEIKHLREEKAVDSLIELLKEGKYKKATVKLGELRGMPEDFLKLYEYLAWESPLSKVKIRVKPVKAKIQCLSCDWKGDPEILKNGVRCPRCKGDVKILRGNEFSVEL